MAISLLAEHPDEYNALWVGASGIFRGVDPTVVDPLLREFLPEFKSFNLACRGMYGLESDYVLRRAVRIMGDSLDWVIVEPSNWSPALVGLQVDTARTQNWHDLPTTALSVRATYQMWRSGRPSSGRWLLYHLKEGLHRLGNYGLAESLFRGLTGRLGESYLSPESLSASRGYVSIHESSPQDAAGRRRQFLAGLDEYMEMLEGLSDENAGYLTAYQKLGHHRQREWLREQGLRVLYLMPPYASSGWFARLLEGRADSRPILNYCRPERYPELYEPDVRVDSNHLNETGAELFSRLIGERLAAALKKGS